MDEYNNGQGQNGADNYTGQPYDQNGYDQNAYQNSYDQNYQDNSGYQNNGYDQNYQDGYDQGYQNTGYDQGYQGGYDQTQYDQPAVVQPEEKATLAIVSLICGIVSIVSCFCCIGPTPGIAAIITGIISRKDDKPGKGMAIAGIILGAVSIVLTIGWVILAFATGMMEDL